MAFTVTFPTTNPTAEVTEIARWLADLGEPFDAEAHTLSLRALPLRIVAVADAPMQAWIDVDIDTPLVRLVDLLFELSNLAGADVRLTGKGEVTRASLWLRLADEQDRRRIASVIAGAEARGGANEVCQRLWAILASLHPGLDLRWDAASDRVVEMLEVGSEGGISLEEAAFHHEGVAAGDLVSRPVDGQFHLLAWRFIAEAYPQYIED